MIKPACRHIFLLPATAIVTVGLAHGAALAASDGAYLDWKNKTHATAAQPDQVQTAGGAYTVPPSPYGQVGDPYGRSLRWPAKQPPMVPAATVAANIPPPQPILAPVPAVPMRPPAPVSVSRPVPLTAPRPVAVVPIPQPVPQPTPQSVQQTADTYPPDPGLADDPDLTPESAPQITPQVAAKSAPQPAHKPAVKPLPAVASAPPPVRTQTLPTPPAVANTLSSDGAYEVPATSKYAARIAAARAAQLPVAEAPKGKADTKSTATAPDPDISLASQEADHVFIPGEQYKTPADEPRLYSLHRQYGMKPDPIEVTAGATGALLTVSPDAPDSDPDDDSSPNKQDQTPAAN